mmetsp:Transcript_30192/g.50744  ORF Transcript_30192/g.50744 Transcript_30192/m.50744 type:complete len:121 (+) Transcript_30192:278-640(+)
MQLYKVSENNTDPSIEKIRSHVYLEKTLQSQAPSNSLYLVPSSPLAYSTTRDTKLFGLMALLCLIQGSLDCIFQHCISDFDNIPIKVLQQFNQALVQTGCNTKLVQRIKLCRPLDILGVG